MFTIAVLGTFDTKGVEHAFVAERIRGQGIETLMIDVGTGGSPQVKPDVTRHDVALAADLDREEIVARADRGGAIAAMTKAAPVFVSKLVEEGRIHGIISLGGGGGTAVATAAMRALPLGFPKLMVSTLASGNTAHYVGVKDIVMFPSVVDIAGLNRISRLLLTRAAGAICGMVSARPEYSSEDRPIIAASQFGNTTECVDHARKLLEAKGYEVLVFHATGTGGRTMESLIEGGVVAGVLDVTTTEWADEFVGGVLSAGPTRLEAAALSGIPAVVAPGCLDMVNFGAPDTVPARFSGRTFYHHNPQVTLMRTDVEECAGIGKVIAEKVNRSTGPVAVMLPTQGLSVIGAECGPFHDPDADVCLFGTLRSELRGDIPVREVDANINDSLFAEACVKELLRIMGGKVA